MNDFKMHTPDLTQENLAKLRELFPGVVTETRDAAGRLRLGVDLDQLRQELSDQVVEGPQERYQLNWPGKRDALLAANAPAADRKRLAAEWKNSPAVAAAQLAVDLDAREDLPRREEPAVARDHPVPPARPPLPQNAARADAGRSCRPARPTPG